MITGGAGYPAIYLLFPLAVGILIAVFAHPIVKMFLDMNAKNRIFPSPKSNSGFVQWSIRTVRIFGMVFALLALTFLILVSLGYAS